MSSLAAFLVGLALGVLLVGAWSRFVCGSELDDGYRCAVCGDRFPTAEETIEHVSRHRGG